MAADPIQMQLVIHFSECERGLVEMFLDRTDLSKTVDKHGMERRHALSHFSRFSASVLVEQGPVLTKNG